MHISAPIQAVVTVHNYKEPEATCFQGVNLSESSSELKGEPEEQRNVKGWFMVLQKSSATNWSHSSLPFKHSLSLQNHLTRFR